MTIHVLTVPRPLTLAPLVLVVVPLVPLVTVAAPRPLTLPVLGTAPPRPRTLPVAFFKIPLPRAAGVLPDLAASSLAASASSRAF
jgi:hypothetical protein